MRESNNTQRQSLIPRPRTWRYDRSLSQPYDELSSVRSYLRYMCVDQSNIFTSIISWFVFLLLTIVVPLFSHFYLSCSSCDFNLARPFDGVVQLSLSSVAALSFICLTHFVRRYGLRRFLFFDKLVNESDSVRHHYTAELNRSLKILSIFVVPCFIAETTYKVWWYSSGASRIPLLGNTILSDVIACSLEVTSWLYRTLVFFLVCILFRLICYLQILRLRDFASVFEVDSDVGSVLMEHLSIRKHLRVISHRYRAFILFTLVLITASQLAFMVLTTEPRADLSVFRAGELALCSVTLLAGLMIILRSATKITHKTQAITCLATKWHACATIDSFIGPSDQIETAIANTTNTTCPDRPHDASDSDEPCGEEDDVDNTKFLPAYASSTISYQKRQALVTYLKNNKAGITIYGFMLDRTWLQLIFGIELSLVLFLLKQTIHLV